jgi:hypothetical protein
VSGDERPIALAAKLGQLSAGYRSDGSVTSGESSMLSRRLDLFNDQRAETMERLTGRQQEIAGKLHRWSDFDARYQQLMDELKFVEAKVDDVDSLGLDEAVAKLQNVSFGS